MQRKVSATKLQSLCAKGEFILIVEGTVIKSPPFGKMRNQSSYKKRWMDLVRIDTQTDTIHDPSKGRTTSIDGRSNSFDKVLGRLRRTSSTSSSTSSVVIEEQQESHYLIRYWNKWESKNKGLAPKKTIVIDKSFTVKMQEHPIFPEKYPYTFSLNTPSRNYYVNADSEEMLNKWQTHIAEAIEQADKKYASIEIKTDSPLRQTQSADSGTMEDIEEKEIKKRPKDIKTSSPQLPNRSNKENHWYENMTDISTPSTPTSPKDEDEEDVLEEEKHSHIQFEDVQIEFPVGTQVDCSISDTITFVTENATCVISKVVHV